MRRLFLIWIGGLLLGAVPLAAQPTNPYRHPQKVEIKPRSTLGDDSLKVWGGIMAGADADTIIVFADGTLNTSAAIPDGSVTFAKLADEGCADADVISWDDTGAVWECSSSATSGLTAAGSYDITGTWRFDNHLLLGNITGTAQRELHLQQASTNVGIRLERTSTGSYWEIDGGSNLRMLMGSTLFLHLEGSSGNVGIGVSPSTNKLDIDGDVRVRGDLRLNSQMIGSAIPDAADSYDLGSALLPWRVGHIAQLSSTVFEVNTQQLFNGFNMVVPIAGRFAGAVAAGDTSVDLGQTISTIPSWILVRSYDAGGVIKTEYLELLSCLGSVCTVDRDVTEIQGADCEGTASCVSWLDGTSYAWIGEAGNGRIEFNAGSGLPRISIATQGASAGAVSELVRIGALDGYGGLPANKVGIAIGTGTNSLIYYDGTLTIAGDGSDVTNISGSNISTGTLDASVVAVTNLNASNIATGSLSADRLTANSIDATHLQGTTLAVLAATTGSLTVDGTLTISTNGDLRSGATDFLTGTGYWLDYNEGEPRFRIGDPAGNRVSWDGVNLTVQSAGFLLNEDGLQIGTADDEGDFSKRISFAGSNGPWIAYYGGALHIGESDRTVIGADLNFSSAQTTVFLRSDNGFTSPGSIDAISLLLDGKVGAIFNADTEFVTDLYVGPADDDELALGAFDKRWKNINLALSENAAPYYVVVNKGTGDDANTALGYAQGVTGTIVVKGSTGANCNLVFQAGLLMSETCP